MGKPTGRNERERMSQSFRSWMFTFEHQQSLSEFYPAGESVPKKGFRSILINEGHEAFGAFHVFGVARAQRARKRILLHIHPVNESRANRQ
jgi:hypothetical protein